MYADELRKKLGTERYDEARAEARRLAPTTGLKEDAAKPSPNLEKAVFAAIDRLHACSSIKERLAAARELYSDLPSYALVSDLATDYEKFPAADKAGFWELVAENLSSPDDALSRPFEYLLWVRFFEAEGSVSEAWAALVERRLPDVAVTRLLGSSGPVPYLLKEPLYEMLVGESKWHPAIFQSLWNSTADVFGKIVPKKALPLLAKLELPGRDDEKKELREALEARPELEIAGLAMLPLNLLGLVTGFLVGEPLDLDGLAARQAEVLTAIERWKASRPPLPKTYEGAFDLALRFNNGEIKKRVNVRLGIAAGTSFLLSVDEEAPKKALPAPAEARPHFDDLKKVFRAFTKQVWLRGEYERAITKLLWLTALQHEAVQVQRGLTTTPRPPSTRR